MDRVEEGRSSRSRGLTRPTHAIAEPVHTPPGLITQIRVRTHDRAGTALPLRATGSAFVDEIARTAAADVKDGRVARLLPLEFFVETEDRPLAALVDVSDAAAAGCEVAGCRCGERG